MEIWTKGIFSLISSLAAAKMLYGLCNLGQSWFDGTLLIDLLTPCQRPHRLPICFTCMDLGPPQPIKAKAMAAAVQQH